MDKERSLTPGMIRSAVCIASGISESELMARGRSRSVADARKILAYMLAEKRLCRSVSGIASEVSLCRNSVYKLLYGFDDLISCDLPFMDKYIRTCSILDTPEVLPEAGSVYRWLSDIGRERDIYDEPGDRKLLNHFK